MMGREIYSEKFYKKADMVFNLLAYGYVLLPVMIFLIGWCKWYIGIPCVVVLGLCFVMICSREKKTIYQFQWSEKEIVTALLVFLVILFWVGISGVGGFAFQNKDHICRNAIFEILVENPWPVITNVGQDGSIRGLIYYIGFWLPAAVFGKIFGIEAGYYFQCFWAILGIYLFYYFICVWRKKIDLWPLGVFILFSGLDLLGQYLIGERMWIYGHNHLEWWSYYFQFSSFMTQLFWVFNQAIPAWIITIMILLQKDNKKIVLIWSTAMLCSTFPFVGLIPFLVYKMLHHSYEGHKWGKKSWWKCFWKDTCTFENIVGGGCVGILSFLYLIGNLSANHITTAMAENGITQNGAVESGMVSNHVNSVADFFITAIVFFTLEVGIYVLMVYRYEKKNPLLYITIGWLIFCMFSQVGYGGDFCMRASIPALVVLYMIVIKAVTQAHLKNHQIWLSAFIIIFTIGSFTAIFELNRSIFDTAEKCLGNAPPGRERVSDEAILNGNNFSGDLKDNFFFHYVAK